MTPLALVCLCRGCTADTAGSERAHTRLEISVFESGDVQTSRASPRSILRIGRETRFVAIALFGAQAFFRSLLISEVLTALRCCGGVVRLRYERL
jgi:hypothetical protein